MLFTFLEGVLNMMQSEADNSSSVCNNPMYWWMGYGKEPESYQGPYATKDEAIAMGKVEAHAEGAGFTIVEANSKVMSVDIFDSLWIDEQLEEHNEECWGEDGMPHLVSLPEHSRELEQALAATLKAWLDKYNLWPHVWSFDVMQNEEYFPPPNSPTES